MRKSSKAFFLHISLFSLFSSFSIAIFAQPQDVKPYSPETILLKLQEPRGESFIVNAQDKFGSRVERAFHVVPNLFLMKLPQGITVEKALEWYSKQPEVIYAEPNYQAKTADDGVVEEIEAPTIETTDTLFSSQWSLHNTGQSGGTVDADINGPESWVIQIGSQTPVIGIIDSGVDYNHVDLAGNLWHNSGEIPGNGIDDDINGYVDDEFGINAITGTGNPLDDFHHGTRLAGIIGAVANNSVGITGVMNVASMAACKFLNSSGSGTASDAIECIQYFANLKTRFYSPENIVAINNSWVLNAKSQAMQDAIVSLRDLGILFIAAAGNAGTNNDTSPTYPANYPVTNIISVAATDRTDLKPSYSNYGKATVHIAAPGSSIISTIPSNSYGTSSGSSLAAPHVTGLVGLLVSEFPSMNWAQIKNLTVAGGKVLTNLQSVTMSGRRIRGADLLGVGSLTCMDQVVKARMEPINTNLYVAKDSAVLLKAMHVICDSPNGSVTLYDDGTTSVVLADTGIDGDDVADDGVYSLNWLPSVAGDYDLDFGSGDIVTVHVYDPSTWHNYNVAVDSTFTAETFTGTSLGGGDETVTTLTSPFPILFGGDAIGFSTLYISSNGALSFTNSSVVPGANVNIPVATPATMVSLFWDDLTFTAAGAAIYYQVLGSAPNRKLVVEWRNFKQFNVSGTGTVQVIFYEGSSNIRMAYKDTDLGSASYNSGKSATVGLQMTSSLYKVYSYLQANVPNNRSLLYTLQP